MSVKRDLKSVNRDLMSVKRDLVSVKRDLMSVKRDLAQCTPLLPRPPHALAPPTEIPICR
jgi:hypothetical protein